MPFSGSMLNFGRVNKFRISVQTCDKLPCLKLNGQQNEFGLRSYQFGGKHGMVLGFLGSLSGIVFRLAIARKTWELD